VRDASSDGEADDDTVIVKRRRPELDADDTLIAQHRDGPPVDSTVRLDRAGGHAEPAGAVDATVRTARADIGAHGDDVIRTFVPPAARTAGDGSAPQSIYRPRPVEPVLVRRSAPTARAPQAPVDTAAQQHVARTSRLRAALLVTAAVAVVAAVGIAVLILVLAG